MTKAGSRVMIMIEVEAGKWEGNGYVGIASIMNRFQYQHILLISSS